MSHDAAWADLAHQRFPRVSGDEPLKLVNYRQVDEFSPRERG